MASGERVGSLRLLIVTPKSVGNRFRCSVVVVTIMDTECSIWQGHPDFYQEQALISVVESGKRIWPWSWVTPHCGSEGCLEPGHLDISGPQSLDYPPYICVYCGQPADTRDHIIPTALTGVERRNSVLTVPACRQCNSAIGSTIVFSIDGRRTVAQAYIRRKYGKALKRPDYTPSEIQEFEGSLRLSVIASQEEKVWVQSRLEWPKDPDYDLRHLQASGISNPFVAGLLSS